MPHGKNGKVLSVRDAITIRATVRLVQTGEEYCNITAETDEPMYPGTSNSTITLNAKQVEKAE